MRDLLTDNRNRDLSIDLLRGFGILLMVMGHVGFGGTFEFIKSSFNMPTFFLISGFLFHLKDERWYRGLSKKVIRIIIPYLFFVTFTAIYIIIYNVCTTNEKFLVNDFLKGIIWGNKGIFPISGALWFLQAMLFVEVVFYCLARINNKTLSIIIVLLLIVCSILIDAFNVSLPFSIDSAIGLFIFYAVGAQYCYSRKDVSKELNGFLNCGLIVSALCIGVTFIFINGNSNPRTCTYGKSYLIYVLIALAINWALFRMFKSIAKAKNRNQLYPLIIPGIYSLAYLGFNQIVIFNLNLIAKSLFEFNLGIAKGIRSATILCLTYLIIWFFSEILYKTRLKVLIGKM